MIIAWGKELEGKGWGEGFYPLLRKKDNFQVTGCEERPERMGREYSNCGQEILPFFLFIGVREIVSCRWGTL